MKKKRILTVCLAAAVAVSSFGPSVYGAQPGVSADEAVYVNLDYYGIQKDISIVKGCSLNKNREFTDYGAYEDVINMTNYAVPQVKGDSVTWKFEDDVDRFYFETKPKDGAIILPWSFDVSYKLNGVPKKAEELRGASGLVEINIEAIPNEKALDYYKNNMLLQVATMVNTEDAYSLEAPGAQLQSMGTYKAVIFAALPGEHTTFTLRIGTDSFETDGITMMMIPGTLEQMKEIKDIKEAKDKIKDSADAIHDSLNDIIGTLEGMSGGLSETREGLKGLNAARDTISKGKDALYGNADEALDDLSNISEELNKLVPHLQNAQTLVTDINGNINDIVATIDSSKKQLEEFKSSMTAIQSDIESLRTMLKDMDAKKEDRKEIFKNIKGNLKRISDSMDELRGDCQNMKTSSAMLHTSTNELKNISNYVYTINYAIKQCLTSLVAGGVIPPEVGGSIGEATGSIDEDLRQIEHYCNNSLTDLADFLDSTEDMFNDLKGLCESGSNLSDALQKGVDLGDEYLVLLEDNYDNFDSLLEETENISRTFTESFDQMTKLIDNVDTLNDTLNNYKDGTVSMLKDMETLTTQLGKGLTSSVNFFTAFENLLRQSGNQLDAGTMDTLNGLIGVLQQGIDGIAKTPTLRNANDTIKDAVDKELDTYENENNLLNLDAEQEMISFTSSKNPAPDSIQVILRTDEITKDDMDDGITDFEGTPQKEGFFARIGSIFKKIADKVKSIFE